MFYLSSISTKKRKKRKLSTSATNGKNDQQATTYLNGYISNHQLTLMHYPSDPSHPFMRTPDSLFGTATMTNMFSLILTTTRYLSNPPLLPAPPLPSSAARVGNSGHRRRQCRPLHQHRPNSDEEEPTSTSSEIFESQTWDRHSRFFGCYQDIGAQNVRFGFPIQLRFLLN